MEAENERIISEAEHQRVTTLYAQVQDEVNNELKEHKRSISKSKYASHYYYYCILYSYICNIVSLERLYLSKDVLLLEKRGNGGSMDDIDRMIMVYCEAKKWHNFY